MWDRRRLMLAGGAVLAAGRAFAAPRPPPPAFPGGDIALLRQAYGALHPGLLRYSTAAAMERRFDGLARAFDTAPDLAGRYLALSRFLATLKCGHSYANFYNQPTLVQSALFEGRTRLPFRFLWLGERMIVTADPTGAGLKPGVEVTHVDGRPAAEILRRLMTVARADGSNDDKRRRLMSVTGDEGYQSFDVFHPLMFGGHERYDLRVTDPNGRCRAVRVDAIDLATRRAQSVGPAREPGAPLWRFAITGRTAVLTMPTWALYDSQWDWRRWLDATFEEIAVRGAAGLIIDIRDNEGGDNCGDAILARLIGAPLAMEDRLRLVRYRRVPDTLMPYLETYDPSFRDWGAAARPYDARYFRLAQSNEDGRPAGEISPKGPRFRGKVAVLIGPENSSATFIFAQRLRRAGLGVLVGEPTGGNQRGLNGGAFFFLRLPESGLEADLPLIGQYPVGERPDAGLRPDIAAPLTAAAIAAGEDVAMAAALRAVG
jgi:hypothetical protein